MYTRDTCSILCYNNTTILSTCFDRVMNLEVSVQFSHPILELTSVVYTLYSSMLIQVVKMRINFNFEIVYFPIPLE